MADKTKREEPHWFFVYGTLMRSGSNHQHFFGKSNVQRVLPAHLYGYKMYSLGGFPGCVSFGRHVDSVPAVKGELILVGSDTYKQTVRDLDQLEGHPNFYRRIAVTPSFIQDNKQQKVLAWMYELVGRVPPEKDRIYSNSWEQHLSTKVA